MYADDLNNARTEDIHHQQNGFDATTLLIDHILMNVDQEPYLLSQF